MNTDLCILGAGIAGLRCGIELLKRKPHLKIVMLEKYGYTGGRVVTYKQELDTLSGLCRFLQWENGAGRVSESHTRICDLIDTYSLTRIPLTDTIAYEEDGLRVPNLFTETIQLLVSAIETLPPDVLATNTLRTVLEEILGEEHANALLLQFPYRAEVDTLRADLGLESFREEMGTYKGYFVVKEGLSALIQGMKTEFEQRGGTLFQNHEVTDIHREGSLLLVSCATPNGQVLFETPTVICALHKDALDEIPLFKGWKTLSHLKMEPLVRIYAVFPTKKGTSWFADLPKVVSKGPLRFCIPMNPACGTVMLSYTDGKDARSVLQLLEKRGEGAVQHWILEEARKAFPDKHIPDPVFFKIHPWTSGCTYWLPGSYDPETESRQSLKPFSDLNLYCCGESFSLKQAWMEGAVEQADFLLDTYF
jgi:hypothetical protein